MCEKCMSVSDAEAKHSDRSEFHTKPFNYEHAKAGAPISFGWGAPATVLTFQRQGIKGAHHPILVEDLTGATTCYSSTGQPSGNSKAFMPDAWHLVMRPLGYCEGRPVYTDDILHSPDDIPWAVGVNMHADDLGDMLLESHWPVVYPKSLMSFEELNRHAGTAATWEPRARNIADAAIAHAIKSGQVILKE